MNRHIKRGLIAFLIAFSVVVFFGAVDLYLDPPIDVPSVGYYAYGYLAKTILALAAAFGLTLFVLTSSLSAVGANLSKKSVWHFIVAVILIFGLAYLYVMTPPTHPVRINHQ